MVLRRLHGGVKRYGVAAEFVVYPREPHGFHQEKHLLDRLNRILSWYDGHLKMGARQERGKQWLVICATGFPLVSDNFRRLSDPQFSCGRLPSRPRAVAQRFTAVGVRVTVLSRTAIQAPGGWASDREPAKRFDGRPSNGRIVAGITFPEKRLVSLCACHCVTDLACHAAPLQRTDVWLGVPCQSEVNVR
jgi:hypothetical protein